MIRDAATIEIETTPADGRVLVVVEPVAVAGGVAAAMVGLSARTWRKLNAAGLVPMPVRVGRSRRWAVEELRAWAAAGCPARGRWETIRNATAGSTAFDRRSGTVPAA